MERYVYLGSTKENHFDMISIGRSVGLQHCPNMSMGDKIADLASRGVSRYVQVCIDHPEFFASV